MRLLFARNFVWYLFILLFVGGVAAYYFYPHYFSKEIAYDTVQVTRGDVAQLVTISGRVEAKHSARVGFPTIGTVKQVYKSEGEQVTEGEILASLTQDSLVADYNAALEHLRYLESVKAEIVRGPEEEAREVTRTSVQIAEDDLARVRAEQSRLVDNARKTLLSSNLEAVPTSLTNDDVPPTITGNYLCDEEGSYILSIFGSGSPSGYSYRLSGLETGTFSAYTDTPAPLGTCGLVVQFDDDESYRADDWVVTIPNTRSSNYIANQNAYSLALQQERNTVTAAEQALELARNTEVNLNAPPTREELDKINAQLAQARATLGVKEAQIADYTIKAPFDAIVTDSNIKVGETVDPSRAITLVKEGFYELKARVPEVDITKVAVGDTVRVNFDAAPDELVLGKIDFISPLSLEVEGNSYYEARIVLNQDPAWLREGLNADISIILNEKVGVLRLPKRYVFEDAQGSYVLTRMGGLTSRMPASVGLSGNDGYVEVLNLPEGTTVTTP